MSKVILYIACSIDGYIARPDGGLDWLYSLSNPDKTDHGYSSFYETIGATIMGSNTYNEIKSFGIKWPYSGITSYVASLNESLEMIDREIVRVDGKIDELVEHLKSSLDKDIWLIGGGKLVSWFLDRDLVDRLMITIAPVILGDGVSLFPNEPKESKWIFSGSETFSTGAIMLSYNKLI